MRAAVLLSPMLLAACGGGGSPPADPPSLAAPPANPDASSAPTTPAAPDARPGVLAIAASARLDPAPTTLDQFAQVFNEALQLARDAGARGDMTTYHWHDLEPDQTGYDQRKFDELSQTMERTRQYGLTQFIGIQLINTSKREMPADLTPLAFDDVAVKARFHALLDKVIKPHVGRIKYLSIGNEVDAYLRANPTQWSHYQAFYEDAAQYAKSLDPVLRIGVTATAAGAISESPSELAKLNQISDVVILTYYPLDFNGGARVTVRDPSVVAADFKQMLRVAGSKPLVLQEVGYPASSSVLGSSQAKQSDFVTQVFAAWQYAGGRIPFLTYFLLHDITPDLCDSFTTYYGANTLPGFKEYLCTLGLRQANGTPRQAWSTLVNEAKAAHLP